MNVLQRRIEVGTRWRMLPGIIGVLLLLALFPPFHVRPLGVIAVAAPGTVEVARVAQQFWDNELLKETTTPIEVGRVIKLLDDRHAAASVNFGHHASVGGIPYFFVSGRARVVAVDPLGVWLSADGSNHRQLLLKSGPIFGDALRDATGRLQLADFTSSDFNVLSVELNRRADSVAQALLQSPLTPGVTVDFIGAAAIDDATAPEPFLRLVPVRARIEP